MFLEGGNNGPESGNNGPESGKTEQKPVQQLLEESFENGAMSKDKVEEIMGRFEQEKGEVREQTREKMKHVIIESIISGVINNPSMKKRAMELMIDGKEIIQFDNNAGEGTSIDFNRFLIDDTLIPNSAISLLMGQDTPKEYQSNGVDAQGNSESIKSEEFKAFFAKGEVLAAEIDSKLKQALSAELVAENNGNGDIATETNGIQTGLKGTEKVTTGEVQDVVNGNKDQSGKIDVSKALDDLGELLGKVPLLGDLLKWLKGMLSPEDQEQFKDAELVAKATEDGDFDKDDGEFLNYLKSDLKENATKEVDGKKEFDQKLFDEMTQKQSENIALGLKNIANHKDNMGGFVEKDGEIYSGENKDRLVISKEFLEIFKEKLSDSNNDTIKKLLGDNGEFDNSLLVAHLNSLTPKKEAPNQVGNGDALASDQETIPAQPKPKETPKAKVETSENKTHTVEKGDTMWKIASNNNIDLKDLIASNPQIDNPNLIFPGQQINIPKEGASEQA